MKTTGEIVSLEPIDGQTTPLATGNTAYARVVAAFPTGNGVVVAPILLPCTIWIDDEFTFANIANCGEFKVGDKIDIYLKKSGDDLIGITKEDIEQMPNTPEAAAVYFNKIIRNRLNGGGTE